MPTRSEAREPRGRGTEVGVPPRKGTWGAVPRRLQRLGTMRRFDLPRGAWTSARGRAPPSRSRGPLGRGCRAATRGDAGERPFAYARASSDRCAPAGRSAPVACPRRKRRRMSTLDDVPEELALAVGEAEKLGRRLVRPGLRAHERARDLPDDVLREAFALGAPLAALPEAGGGLGLGFAGAVRLEEALATADPAFPFALGSATTLGLALLELGGVEAARAPLARLVASEGRATAAVAFCDAEDAETTAEPEGEDVRLRGTKRLVVEGDRASDVLSLLRGADRGGPRTCSTATRWLGAVRAWPRSGSIRSTWPTSRSTRVPAAAEVGCRARPRSRRRAVLRAARRARRGARRRTRALRLRRGARVRHRGARSASPSGTSGRGVHRGGSRDRRRGGARARAPGGGRVGRARRRARRARTRPTSRSKRRCLLATAARRRLRAAGGGARGGRRRPAARRRGLHAGLPREKLLRDAKALELCTLSPEHAAQLAAACELEIPPDPALVLLSPSSKASCSDLNGRMKIMSNPFTLSPASRGAPRDGPRLRARRRPPREPRVDRAHGIP